MQEEASSSPSRIRRSLLAFVLALGAGAAPAQEASPPAFKPAVGQPGKDVMWVPTSQALVEKMLDMAGLKPDDSLIDLGSGDGRTVITAARRGARALGIEYNPAMVELSKANAQKEGVSDRADFVKADIFASDFSKATVITMFLLDEINLRLRPAILDLKPGTRIVSNTFTMGEWPPDQTADASSDEGCRTYCKAYLWIVPAKAEGSWKLSQGGELTLSQQFQQVSGQMATAGGGSAAIADGHLRGDRLTFTAGGVDYSGRIDGDRIEGTSSGSPRTWTAVRAPRP